MSHPFGDLVSQHLHRRHGLSQSKLAAGILQAPTIITAMCKGQRLTGPQARERVLAIIGWLHAQGALDTREEASELLQAAGMTALNPSRMEEARLAQKLARSIQSGDSDHNASFIKHNLPSATTSLIGRGQDIQAVHELLKRDDVRLITLIGPPGIGKTRLALQAGWNALNDFADGVWFVPLATIDDSKFVAETILQTLKVDNTSLLPQIVLPRLLRNKHLLLILDNFEQLLGDDDTSTAATLLTELLASAPKLKVIVTSRTAMRLQGEHQYPVPQLSASSAVDLFVARAQAIKPAFTIERENARIIAEICQRVDYLPLAIELAAARVRLFEPALLLARLSTLLDVLIDGARDLPTRQRTLRNTIAWSYNLLSSEEQMLFRRLGIFAGGCTLDAAEKVAGESLHLPVLDLLQSLADKSLVMIDIHVDEPRYSMLETLHQYSIERLEQSGESEMLRKRHAHYFAAYAESIEPTFSMRVSSDWLKQLEREHDNFAIALAEARRTDDAALQTRFIAAMHPLLARLHDPEGWSWLRSLFARSEARANPLAYAKALYGSVAYLGLGNFAIENGQPLWMQNAASIFESLGETVWQAACLASLGIAVWIGGTFALAQQYCAQSTRLYEEAGHKELATNAMACMAYAQRDQGKYAEAERLFKQCLNMFGDSNDDSEYGALLYGLGELEYDRGDIEAAHTYYEAARAPLNGTVWRELPQLGKGQVAYAQGSTLEAVRLLETCVVDARSWGNTELLMLTLPHLALVQQLLGDETKALALLHEALALQHEHMAGRVIPGSLERAAWIAAGQRHHRRAAVLFSAAEAMRKQLGAPLPLGDKPLYDRYLAEARAGLDSDDFGKAWVEAAVMSFDQVMKFAMQTTD